MCLRPQREGQPLSIPRRPGSSRVPGVGGAGWVLVMDVGAGKCSVGTQVVEGEKGGRGEVAVGIKGVGLILEVVSMCVVMRAVMVVLMGRG